MSLGWMLFEIGLNAFDAAYSLSFPTAKCGLKDGVNKRDVLFYWFFLVTAYSLINFTTNFSLISLYLFPLLVLFYAYFFIQGSLVQKVLWTILPAIVMYAMEFTIAHLFVQLTGLPLESSFESGIFRAQIALTGKAFDLIFCVLVLRRRDFQFIGLKRSVLFAGVNLLCLMMIALLFVTRTMDDVYYRSFFLFVPTVVFLLNMVSFIIQGREEWKNQKALKLREENLRTELALRHEKERTERESQHEKECAERDLRHQKELTQLRKELEENYYHALMAVYGTYSGYRENLVMLFSQTAWSKRTDSKEISTFIEANKSLIAEQPTAVDLIDITLLVLKFNAANYGITINLHVDLAKATIKEIIIDPHDVSVIMHSLVSQGIDILRAIKSDPDLTKTIDLQLTTDPEYFKLRIEYPANGETDYTFLDRDTIERRKSVIWDMIKWHQGYVALENQDYYLSISIDFSLPVTGRYFFARKQRQSVLKRGEAGENYCF